MNNSTPSFLRERPSAAPFTKGKGRIKIPFLEKGIDRLAQVIQEGHAQWESSSGESVIHRIDGRVKVLFLLFFIVIVSLKKDVMSEAVLGCFVFLLVIMSGLNIFRFYRKVLFLGFLFGFLVALPSAFNVITRGEMVLPLIHLPRSYQFWVYEIPADIGITRQGLQGVLMLFSRVLNSLSLSFLVLSTTSFPEIIKSLKVLKVPDSFLMVITLSYKYLFIFAKTVEDMHRAKKSRLVRQISSAEAGNWTAGRIGFVFRKTRLRCEEIFKAMLGRGFSQDIKFYEPRKLNSCDLAAGTIFFLAGIFFLWM